MVSSVEGCSLNSSCTRPSSPFRKGPQPLPLPGARTPSPLPEACGDWVRWGRTMEEKPFEASAKSSGRHDSVRSSLNSDIRNLWTTAVLSQSRLNVPLTSLCEDSELEGSSTGSKTDQWYNQKETLQDSEGAWKQWDDRKDKPEELGPDNFQGSDLEGDEDPGIKMETPSSMASPKISKHTPHRAYWVEQQNRLPLPLVELMESEALEILTKALQSYRSGIGKDHFLTKQLQRYIEGLKRRRSKRQHVLVH